MAFPLGRPVLAMLLLAAGSGTALLLRPASEPAGDLTVWVFAESHARAYREGPPGGGPGPVERFRQRTGRSVDVRLISARAMDVRLLSLFHNESGDVPDLVELEIGSVGKFFRPPVEGIGFLPLNGLIERDGVRRLILPSRWAPWSKGGAIFGVPLDVHPVAIAYRKDLFDAAGVDLAACRTWEAFHEAGLRYQAHWRSRGVERRYAIGLPGADADRLLVLLLQRGVNLVDEDGAVRLADAKVVDTLARYATMVAGERKVADDETPGGHLWARDFAEGALGAVLVADWRVADLRHAAPEAAGKAALMALPVWEAGDAPTSTWGGTMIGIPRRCRDPEASWELLKFLALEGRAERRSDILAAMPSRWRTGLEEGDAYFGGQRARALFADLAGKIPEVHISPFRGAAKEALSVALTVAVSHVREHGEAGLREACRRQLEARAEDVRRLIARGGGGFP